MEKDKLMGKCLPICVEAIRAAEMRQGCTNHTYYAEILLKQLNPIISQAVVDVVKKDYVLIPRWFRDELLAEF